LVERLNNLYLIENKLKNKIEIAAVKMGQMKVQLKSPRRRCGLIFWGHFVQLMRVDAHENGIPRGVSEGIFHEPHSFFC